MGKAILERFDDKDFKFGVNYKDQIKQDTETRLEQELTGIRPEYTKSFLSLYGKESVRIVSQGQVDGDELRNNVVNSISNGISNNFGNIGGVIGDGLSTINDRLFNDGKTLKPSELIEKDYQFYATDKYNQLTPNPVDRNIIQFRDGITNLQSIVPNAKALALNSAKDAVRGKIGGFLQNNISVIGDSINEAAQDPNSISAAERGGQKYGPDIGTKKKYSSTIPTNVEEESERNLLKYRSRSPVDVARGGGQLFSGTGRTGKSFDYNEVEGDTSKEALGKFSSPIAMYSKGGDISTRTFESKYGMKSDADKVNLLGVGDDNLKLSIDGDENIFKKQLIPFKITNAANGQYAYFRAAITSWSEQVSPSWDSNKFVGNPFTLYSYSGVERSVSFNLKMYSTNFAEHQKMWEKIKFLTSLAYPASYYPNSGAVISPFIKLTVGDMFKDRRGFIQSLNYTVDDSTTWETDNYSGADSNLFYDSNGNLQVTDDNNTPDAEGFILPHVVDVAITVNIIEQRATTTFNHPDYRRRLYAFERVGRTSNVGLAASDFEGANIDLQRKEVQSVSTLPNKPAKKNIAQRTTTIQQSQTDLRRRQESVFNQTQPTTPTINFGN